jgi:hypothetical protein
MPLNRLTAFLCAAKECSSLPKSFSSVPSEKKIGKTNTLSKIDEFLAPEETVVWEGGPSKKTVFLQSLAGIPFALILGSIGLVSTLYLDLPLLGFPLILLVLSFCLVVIPQVWFLKRLPDNAVIS